jgi:hypothetical protein
MLNEINLIQKDLIKEIKQKRSKNKVLIYGTNDPNFRSIKLIISNTETATKFVSKRFLWELIGFPPSYDKGLTEIIKYLEI